jgi:hypothetical protein
MPTHTYPLRILLCCLFSLSLSLASSRSWPASDTSDDVKIKSLAMQVNSSKDSHVQTTQNPQMKDEENQLTQSEWKFSMPRCRSTSDDTELSYLGKDKPDSSRYPRSNASHATCKTLFAQGEIRQKTRLRHSRTIWGQEEFLTKLRIQTYRVEKVQSPSTASASHYSQLNRRMLPGRISPGPPSTTPVRRPSRINDREQLDNPHNSSSIGPPTSAQSASSSDDLQLHQPAPNSPINQACAAN